MTRNELFDQIKNSDIKNIYLFYGQEVYLMNTAINNIKNRIEKENGGEIDYIYADGKSITGDEIVEHCCTVSFLSSVKLIVVENLPALINKDAKADESILEYIDRPDDAVLIFLCTAEVSKTSSVYKKLLSKACCVDFSPLSDIELKSYISREMKKYGKKIGNAEMDFLVQYTNTELICLISELNKLALGSEDVNISQNDIEENVTPSRDYKIYRLTDYIMDKNVKEAVELTDLLLSQQEEPIYIVAVIAKTVHNCLVAKHRLGENKNAVEIAKELGVKDFAVKRIIGYSQRYSIKKIEYCNELLLRTDEALKSSSVDSLQQLTVLIVGIINCLKS